MYQDEKFLELKRSLDAIHASAPKNNDPRISINESKLFSKESVEIENENLPEIVG